MDLQTAYYHFKEKEKKYEFIFRYVNTTYNLDKPFRFTLRHDETIQELIIKIKGAIGKAVQRKKNEIASAQRKLEDTNIETYLNIPVENSNLQSNDEFLIDVKFSKLGYDLKSLSCRKFNEIKDDAECIIQNKKYKVLLNKPRIINIVLPKCLYVNYPVYPTDFDGMLFDKNISEYFWHKSEDKEKWQIVGNNYSYVPKIEDLNCYLKFACIPRNAMHVGLLFETISLEPIKVFEDKCPFQKRHNFTKNKLNGSNFRVTSYNILADHYCKSENAKAQYHYCPLDKLSIDYRKQLILKEITGYNSDIICLQEVDYKVFKNFLRPELQKQNYKGFYTPKDSKPEGLACFFNKKRFRMLHLDSIVIGKAIKQQRCLSQFWKKISYNETAAKSLTEQNTVLQVLVLKSLANNNILFVANTHLYFHPDASHIRLLQAAASAYYIENVMNLPKMPNVNKNTNTALIYCGDFNSTPDSGVYTFFTKGIVHSDAKDWTCNKNEMVSDIALRFKRSMESACGTPEYTNYTEDFKACLDYIFYENTKLKVIQILPLLKESDMSANVALPNVGIPSDHVALVADFDWM